MTHREAQGGNEDFGKGKEEKEEEKRREKESIKRLFAMST